MGESIAEGTIVRWIKKRRRHGRSRRAAVRDLHRQGGRGDSRRRRPACCWRSWSREGETVPVDSVVGRDWRCRGRGGGEATGAGGRRRRAVAAPSRRHVGGRRRRRPAPAPPSPIRAGAGSRRADRRSTTCRRRKSSPLVRRIAHDQDVDVEALSGHRASAAASPSATSSASSTSAASPQPSRGNRLRAPASRIPPYQPGEPIEVKPLSVVRRKIAEHMVLSRRTSAHVHTVFHVDFSAVDGIRAAEEGGVRTGGREAHVP